MVALVLTLAVSVSTRPFRTKNSRAVPLPSASRLALARALCRLLTRFLSLCCTFRQLLVPPSISGIKAMSKLQQTDFGFGKRHLQSREIRYEREKAEGRKAYEAKAQAEGRTPSEEELVAAEQDAVSAATRSQYEDALNESEWVEPALAFLPSCCR